MPSFARWLLIGATLLTGFLAGGDLNRAFVAMPAWQHVGAAAWAAFSRNADLANGLFLYPVEAIGGALLIVGAIASLHAAQIRGGMSMRFLYAALVLSVLGLLLTIKAAPIMLGVPDLHDPVALQHAFDAFLFWGNLRSIFQIAAFVSLTCALAGAIASSD
jgi:hypothetical protein